MTSSAINCSAPPCRAVIGGRHPHVTIQDLVFVETVGGDLTIKVEDNTEDGLGIYSEPVDDVLEMSLQLIAQRGEQRVVFGRVIAEHLRPRRGPLDQLTACAPADAPRAGRRATAPLARPALCGRFAAPPPLVAGGRSGNSSPLWPQRPRLCCFCEWPPSTRASE